MGFKSRSAGGSQAERASSSHASDLRQSNPVICLKMNILTKFMIYLGGDSRQVGRERDLRVPSLSHSAERWHLHLELPFEIKGQAV